MVPPSLPAVLRCHRSPAGGGVGHGSSPPCPGHAGPYLLLLRGPRGWAGGLLLPRSPVPVHLQQTHSRPTTQSFKSTRPPPRQAQHPPPEASAEPVRSALPARCRAWPRATQRPALPRVSAAVACLSVVAGGLHYALPSPPLPQPCQLPGWLAVSGDSWGRHYWQEVASDRGLLDTHNGSKCPERTLEGGSVRRGGPAGPSPGRRRWAWEEGS